MTEKQLNPLGSVGQMTVMGTLGTFFLTLAGIISYYGDPADSHTAAGVVWFSVPAIIAFGFFVHEAYLYHKKTEIPSLS